MWRKLLNWYDLHCGVIAVMSLLAAALMYWGMYVGARDVRAQGRRIVTIEVHTEHPYIADVDTEFVHVKSCERVPAEDKCIYFDACETALRIGYRPCGICNP